MGHLKAEGKMRRSYLKGIQGDAMNVLLSACGQNMSKLLKWLAWAEIQGLYIRFITLFSAELESQKKNRALILV